MKILNIIILLANVISFPYAAVSSGMRRPGKEIASSQTSPEKPSKFLKTKNTQQSMKYIRRDIQAMIDELEIMTRNLAGIRDPETKKIYRDVIQEQKQKLKEMFEKQFMEGKQRLSFKEHQPYKPGSQMQKLKMILSMKGINWNDAHRGMKVPNDISMEQFWEEFRQKEEVLFSLMHRAELEYNKAVDGEDKEEKNKTLSRLKTLHKELMTDEELVRDWGVLPYHLEPFKPEGDWEREEMKNIVYSYKRTPSDERSKHHAMPSDPSLN